MVAVASSWYWMLDTPHPLACGGVCGQAVNTSNSWSGGPGLKSRTSRCLLDKELYSILSLFTRVYKQVLATR